MPSEESTARGILIYLPQALRPYADKQFKFVARGQCVARPAVTFPAVGRHCRLNGSRLYWLVTVCVGITFVQAEQQ